MPESSTAPRRARRRGARARAWRPRARHGPVAAALLVLLGPGLLMGPMTPASAAAHRAAPATPGAATPGASPPDPGTTTAAPASTSGEAVLSGRVTSADGPVASAWVTITPVDASGAPAGPPTSAFTDRTGRYEFAAAPPGRVVLLVRSPPASRFADAWFPGVPTLAQATPLALSTGATRADVDLRVAGSVSGRLVDAATGAPVPGRVRAVLADAPGAGDVGTAGSPGEPGAFTISGLPPEQVQLRVLLPPGSAWLAPAPGRATGIVVDGSRDTTDVRVPLEQGAEIRGTVRDDRGAPVERARVALAGCGAWCPPPTATDAAGTYRIPGIRPGTQPAVLAERPGEQVRRWFPDGDDVSAATRIPVRAGDVVDSIDITLPRAAFVTVEALGTRASEPLRAVARLTGASRTYNQYFGYLPGATGPGTPSPCRAGTGAPVRLRVGPIPPGEYSIRVTPGLPAPGLLPQRWVSSETLVGAGSVRVAPGQEVHVAVEFQGSRPPAGGPDPAAGAPANPAPSGCTPTGGRLDWPTGAGPVEATWPGLGVGFLAGGAVPWTAAADGTTSSLADDLALDTP